MGWERRRGRGAQGCEGRGCGPGAAVGAQPTPRPPRARERRPLTLSPPRAAPRAEAMLLRPPQVPGAVAQDGAGLDPPPAAVLQAAEPAGAGRRGGAGGGGGGLTWADAAPPRPAPCPRPRPSVPGPAPCSLPCPQVLGSHRCAQSPAPMPVDWPQGLCPAPTTSAFPSKIQSGLVLAPTPSRPRLLSRPLQASASLPTCLLGSLPTMIL